MTYAGQADRLCAVLEQLRRRYGDELDETSVSGVILVGRVEITDLVRAEYSTSAVLEMVQARVGDAPAYGTGD